MTSIFLTQFIRKLHLLKYLVLALVVLSSCSKYSLPFITTIQKAPKDRPFVVKNIIEVKGGNFTKPEKEGLISRLNNQLDDSSKVDVRSPVFFYHKIVRPPAYDSGFSAVSARNMKASMFHIGYYNAVVNFTADTLKNRRVYVTYVVDAKNPTLIDSVSYRMRRDDLQEIVNRSVDESILQKNNPITKGAVQGEISRLVDTFRNKGYYKFTAAELRVRGDTTIEALTTVSDDPFEQLRILAEAQQQRDSPQIRLAVVLNPPQDSSKLRRYFINNIYILPDFRPGDKLTDSLQESINGNIIIRYHENLFHNSFLIRNLTFKSGDLFRQDAYYTTLNNFSNKGVWQSVNIQTVELSDSSDRVDLVIELVPGNKFGFEAAVEASYSATSNTTNALAGNLFGLSFNMSLLNRNFQKEAIRMMHSFRVGLELNNKQRSSNTRLINSQELSYGNNIVFPRLPRFYNRAYPLAETFINTNFTASNRLDLFNLQSANVSYGWSYITKRNWRWVIRPFNIEFNYLFNQTDSFNRILERNPFLRYSYNTALIAGMGVSLTHQFSNPYHPRSVAKDRSFKINIEESGVTWGLIPLLNKYKRQYIRPDVEYKYLVTYSKTALAFRTFIGVGISLGNDTTLPFFKQYFGGGSNSMRGWPVRGIGRGAQQLNDYSANQFNDRTADMQFEMNGEYRYDIARIIPNTLTLRGALFVDIGNIWNLRNSKADGSTDSTQFRFRNFYKELGVAAGTGFRLDFNYFILRLDFGFRFKRPELSHINDGWKRPAIGFDDFLPKIFGRGEANRRWRYENFNFTIGISYPF